MSSLDRYHAKRDFGATKEPKGTVRKRSAKRLIFVVQAHHARSMHYDFRLELDGALKSWAVPKGPSNDPSEKRLAVEVEDHPIAYATFEGDIPKGQYGAGHVEIWDEGTWSPIGDAHEGLERGKLEFALAGKKLSGRFKLVRMRPTEGKKAPPQWLLIKGRDDAALPAPDAPEASLPLKLSPQLATWVANAPRGEDYGYEIKLDGYRMLARIENGRARLLTRNGHDWTERLPEHVAAIEALGADATYLDGEIVVYDADGVSSFDALQTALASGAKRTDIRFVLFDMPFSRGRDLRDEPLEVRREALHTVMRKNASHLLAESETIAGDVAAIAHAARALGAEGLIGKRRGSRYASSRTTSWIKLPFKLRQDAVIVGYTAPRGARGGFGALVLGVFEGKTLRYAGRVGTGFDEKTLARMHDALSKTLVSRPAVEVPAAQTRDVTWVAPRVVIEVEHSGFTTSGVFRKGVFVAIRPDKSPREAERAAPTKLAVPEAKRGRARSVALVTHFADVELSSPERVVDPKSGLTKRDIAAYYEAVAPHLLVHLAHRPVSLVRAPDGIEGPTFFQKHAKARAIDGVRLMDEALDPGHPPLLAIDSAHALLGAVQMNTIELHTWNATEDDIERPDRAVFDLDPDEALPFARVAQAAVLVRGFLAELGLIAFLKTTGGKGLHVVVPLVRDASWDDVKAFSKRVAEHFARVLPDHFVAKSGRTNRVGRIFIDYLRNGRGSSTVAAFSVRAREGLSVSVPIRWDELAKLEDPRALDMQSVPRRLAKRRVDPWKDYATTRQSITNAMRTKLGIPAVPSTSSRRRR